METWTLIFSAIAAFAALVGMALALRNFLTEDRGCWAFGQAGAVAGRSVRWEADWVGPGAVYDVEMKADPGSENVIMGPTYWARVDADSETLIGMFHPTSDAHDLTGATITWRTGTQRWRRTMRKHVDFE